MLSPLTTDLFRHVNIPPPGGVFLFVSRSPLISSYLISGSLTLDGSLGITGLNIGPNLVRKLNKIRTNLKWFFGDSTQILIKLESQIDNSNYIYSEKLFWNEENLWINLLKNFTKF